MYVYSIFCIKIWEKKVRWSPAQLINRKGFKVTKFTKVCSNHFSAAKPTKQDPLPSLYLKGDLPNEQYFTFVLIWWNFTLCMCYELNKLVPCFMAFADGCIYAYTSSSKTSEKFRLSSSHPSWRLLGKGRLTIDYMVNFSLRLIETSSSSSRQYSFSDLEFQLPHIIRLFS